ncbi:MAG: Crp/Fnr family transcriptional regulator [Pseudomonadota bacterium]
MNVRCETCWLGELWSLLAAAEDWDGRPLEAPYSGDGDQICTVRRVKKGTVLAVDETEEEKVYGVCEGVLARQHFLSDGRRSLVELFLPGEIAALGNSAYNMQFIALTPCELVVFPRELLERARKASERVDCLYFNHLERQANQVLEHCADIARKTPPERLASFLLEYRDRAKALHVASNGEDATGFDDKEYRLPLRGREVGDYLALESETVSRCYSRLAESFAAKLNGGNNVRILNEEKLREIAEGGLPRRKKN